MYAIYFTMHDKPHNTNYNALCTHSLTIWSDYTVSLKLQYNWLITNAKGHPAVYRSNLLRCTATEKHDSILFNFIDITHQ